MSNPWRIALVVALVLLGVGGGMFALRTAKLIEKRVGDGNIDGPDPVEEAAELPEQRAEDEGARQESSKDVH